jgi:hypothetical protein
MDAFFSLPRYAFKRAALQHAPEEAGIYGLFDGEDLIYLGRASDREARSLRSLLLLHQDGALGECTMKATHYTWEIAVWAAAREGEVLRAFRRQHQRDPRCQRAAA